MEIDIFRLKKVILLVLLFASTLFAQKQYSLAINSTAKYQKDFKHYDYVNPNAPKGGILKLSDSGTFDSLNLFTLKGQKAAGLGLMFDSLMTSSLDEPFTSYPLVALSFELSKNNDYIIFHINKNAKFRNGKNITAKDVKFSFETLINKGSPIYKRYYFDVKNVEVLSDLSVKFNFKTNKNKELPAILGQFSIFSQDFWENKDFEKSDNIIAMGSGPYKIEKYKFSKYITYKRDKNYWAKDLNVNKGHYNFDKIKYDYYKDTNVALEAFKAGEFDFRQEYTAKNWKTLYKGKNFDNKSIIKKEIKNEKANGKQGFIFNLRNPLFDDINVRKALNLAFDFQWTNKKLFYSSYKRLNSYFANCELSSYNSLPSKDELKLLNPYKDILPKSIFNEKFKNNVTKGDGKIRKELRTALKILKKAKWKFKNGVLVKNNKKFEFEILLASSTFEKILNPFIKNLKKIGIIARIRIMDSVAYTNKVNDFDFDMIVGTYGVALSPGNELNNYWSSKSANIKGSRNYIGVKSKVVDDLISKIVIAKDRPSLITAVKALDRVMLNNYYLISNWYLGLDRIAYNSKLLQPKIKPKYSLGIHTWWIDKSK